MPAPALLLSCKTVATSIGMNLSGKFELLNVNCMVDERSAEDEDLGSTARVSKPTVIWAERVRLDFYSESGW